MTDLMEQARGLVGTLVDKEAARAKRLAYEEVWDWVGVNKPRYDAPRTGDLFIPTAECERFVHGLLRLLADRMGQEEGETSK